MKTLRLGSDGTGNAKLESLPLPFMFAGPTATDADRAAMPPSEVMGQYTAVRLDSDVERGGRRLVFIVSGSLEVGASYMAATLEPGDVIFVDDLPSSQYRMKGVGDLLAVTLDVADAWTPQGVVPPAVDEERRKVHDPPKLKRMFVANNQAHFGDLDGLCDDPSAVIERPVERAMFLCLSPESFGDWHTEEATSLVVVLAGGFELEVGGNGGDVEVFRAGDVCLVQDHDGQGHITRTHGETRFVAIAVPERGVEWLMDLFEAMETCRSIRRFKLDPVPDEELDKLIYYATRAPSAGNTQHWRFLVVTDPGDRKWFRDMLVEAWSPRLAPPPPDDDHSVNARNARMYRRFILEFDKIPALIITAIENSFPSPETPNPQFMWSSVFAATQNLLLAARGMGLGAAMTTSHLENEPAVREHFGIPDTVGLGATIPIGYPEGSYGPVTRRPASEVIFRNQWGTA